MIAKQTVYLDSERKACLAGPDARVLLVRAGQEISEKDFQEIPGAEALIGSEPTKEATKGDGGKDLEKRKKK